MNCISKNFLGLVLVDVTHTRGQQGVDARVWEQLPESAWLGDSSPPVDTWSDNCLGKACV